MVDNWVPQPASSIKSIDVVSTSSVKLSDELYTLYHLKTTCGNGRVFEVARRFKHFERMHEILQMFFGEESTPVFPTKWSVRDRMSETVVRERRAGLGEYLSELLNRDSIFQSFFVQQFLGLADLSDGTVIITGGVSGMGKEAAKLFASMNATVVITGLFTDVAWSQVESKMRTKSGNSRVYFAEWDPLQIASTPALISRIRHLNLPVRAIVFAHEPGTPKPGLTLHPLVSAHVAAPLALLDALLPYLRERGAPCRLVVACPAAMQAELAAGQLPPATALLDDSVKTKAKVMMALLACLYKRKTQIELLELLVCVRLLDPAEGMWGWFQSLRAAKGLDHASLVFAAVSGFAKGKSGYLLESKEIHDFPQEILAAASYVEEVVGAMNLRPRTSSIQ